MKRIKYPYHRVTGRMQGFARMNKTFPIVEGKYEGMCATVVPFDMGRARIRVHKPDVNPCGKGWVNRVFWDPYLSYLGKQHYDSKNIHPGSAIIQQLKFLGVDMQVVFDRYEAKERAFHVGRWNNNWQKKTNELHVKRMPPKYLAEPEPGVWRVAIGSNRIWEYKGEKSIYFHDDLYVGYIYETGSMYTARVLQRDEHGYFSHIRPGAKCPGKWKSLKSAVIGLYAYDKFKNPEIHANIIRSVRIR